MKVILHADDFGYDEETTLATIELLDAGVLSSATIMPKMPATNIALDYAVKHPEKSFGVHLTYVDNLPSCAKDVTTLVDGNERFLKSDEVRMRALLLKIKKDDIIRESLAQIDVVLHAGVRVSHLDSHGHLHKFPSFLFALNSIAEVTGISKVRRVQNIFVEQPKLSASSILNKLFAHYISRNFVSTDFFYMSANNMDKGWSDAIISQMDLLPSNSVIEVGVHPSRQGYKEEWRVSEYNDIQIFASKLRNNGNHKIINWNDI